jgi:hypothetical protein
MITPYERGLNNAAQKKSPMLLSVAYHALVGFSASDIILPKKNAIVEAGSILRYFIRLSD